MLFSLHTVRGALGPRGLGHPRGGPGGLLILRSVVLGSFRVVFVPPPWPARRYIWCPPGVSLRAPPNDLRTPFGPLNDGELDILRSPLPRLRLNPPGDLRRPAWYPQGLLAMPRPMAFEGPSCGLRRVVRAGEPPLR